MGDGTTQLTFYQCENPKCPHYHIPKQIREYVETGKPLIAEATKCDGSDGCGGRWKRMKDTTLIED